MISNMIVFKINHYLIMIDDIFSLFSIVLFYKVGALKY